MVYKNNIPQPSDQLSDSQADLLENFSKLDTIFDVDHYTYSDVTANVGKHNQVTSPDQGSHPSTAADEPKLYGYKINANFGALQYSRGPSNAVATPITSLQSTAALVTVPGAGSINIVDFTGITQFFGELCIGAYSNTTGAYWKIKVGSGNYNVSRVQTNPLSGTTLTPSFNGANVLIISNTGAAVDIFWTLKIDRIV